MNRGCIGPRVVFGQEPGDEFCGGLKSRGGGRIPYQAHHQLKLHGEDTHGENPDGEDEIPLPQHPRPGQPVLGHTGELGTNRTDRYRHTGLAYIDRMPSPPRIHHHGLVSRIPFQAGEMGAPPGGGQ